MNIAGIPFDTFMQILATAGVPLIIGTFISGLTQIAKASPYLSFISEETPWISRGCVVLLAVVVQLAYSLIHHDPITISIVQSMIVNYFASSVAYTHWIKPFSAPSA